MPDRYGEDPAIDLPDAEWSAAQRRNAINANTPNITSTTSVKMAIRPAVTRWLSQSRRP